MIIKQTLSLCTKVSVSVYIKFQEKPEKTIPKKKQP